MNSRNNGDSLLEQLKRRSIKPNVDNQVGASLHDIIASTSKKIEAVFAEQNEKVEAEVRANETA